jgi:hypothetical protein
MIRVLPVPEGQGAMTPFKWLMVALAVLCAIDSFYWQKKMLRGPRNPKSAAKSTPARR